MGILSRLTMVMKMSANSALDQVEDPQQLVDYAYAQQQELLRRTKGGLIEVAASKIRLERQAKKLRLRLPKLVDQAKRALAVGREDLARITLQRRQTILAEIEQLDAQTADVAREEKRLTHVEQQLVARVEEFRIRRDSISARYTAASAQVKVTEALSGVSGEFADLSMAMGRAMEKTDRMQARAEAIGTLFESGTINTPMFVDNGDPIEKEIIRLSSDQDVDEELAALKAEMELADTPAEAQSDQHPEQTEDRA